MEDQKCNFKTETPWHLAIGQTLTCTNDLNFPKSWSTNASNFLNFFFNSCEDCCRQMFPRKSSAEECNCRDVCDSVKIADDTDADDEDASSVSQLFDINFLAVIAFVVVLAVVIGQRKGLTCLRRFGRLLRPALAVAVVLSFFILLQLNSVYFTIAKTTHVATIENSFREEQNYRYSRHQVQDRCEALKLHQMGRWQHYFFADNTDSLNDEMSNRIRNSYTPLELEWLAGNSSSWMEESVKTEGCAQYRDTHGLMITAKLGNQCACASSTFRPSHSVWINELRPTDGGADADVVLQSPSLRLVERLARENRSLCFMGDSVDNQFYDALRLNLERTLLIKSNYSSFIQKIQAEKIPLNYTNETGPSLYTEGKTRYASHMMRTIITLGENLDKATFKYMRHYGWAPGDTSFLDDCDIVVTNLGLHYEPYSGKLVNPYKSVTAIPNLGPSILASVTYLADFASLDSKISVWRSALPQHFDTRDGHYMFRSSWDDHVCTALKSARNYSQYNRIYKEKFSELKPINESSEEGVCGAYESKVRVNRTSLDLPTVYRYYLEKNCCKEKRERLERLREQGDANVTGTVLRWEIADLFDVPSWHSADRDCTHFCYIPALYEAAFERLDLLIPPL